MYVFHLQFLLIFRKANAGELVEESGLSKLAKLTEIDVVEVGVGGAKEFFEAKVSLLLKTLQFDTFIKNTHLVGTLFDINTELIFQIQQLNRSNKFEDEIRQEQEERKKAEEERQQRKLAFKEKAAIFQNGS